MDRERRDKGLYWDRAWKLVEGCGKVSAGCDYCWSEVETAMRCNHPNEKIRERARAAVGHLAQIPDDVTMFDGRILLREDNLDLPLRTKKPTVWAVWNDLYHEDVPDSFRDRAYAVMALCPQHTFLVLTKRAERMAEYFKWAMGQDNPWLYSWVWHGVTAENQEQADARIPHLLRVPGKRFLSIEPMLGPVGMWFYGWQVSAWHRHGLEIDRDKNPIHAVVLGGESGANARPMNPGWVQGVRSRCETAGVPFFFKQWGEWVSVSEVEGAGVHHRFLDGRTVRRVGKRQAGRILNGRFHDDLPWGG